MREVLGLFAYGVSLGDGIVLALTLDRFPRTKIAGSVDGCKFVLTIFRKRGLDGMLGDLSPQAQYCGSPSTGARVPSGNRLAVSSTMRLVC
jgi:hypothetical protein